MSVTIYVEGGGDHNKRLASDCRRGFRMFLEKAGFQGRMPSIVACGGRLEAFKRFQTALDTASLGHSQLLIDSEAPVTVDDPWLHAAQRPGDQWSKPTKATPEQLHFMVQTMEAWLHGDVGALREYYGSEFREKALAARANVEDIPKAKLFSGLKGATKSCRKGTYSKGDHSFAILALIDPAKVRLRSAYANRFLEYLSALLPV